VCLLPGTEVGFENEVERVLTGFQLVVCKGGKKILQHKVAQFRQGNQDNPCTHHDALEFPDGQSRFGMIVMLISLAATLEVAQRWIPGRHSQFIDFAASVAGTCLGMLAAMVVHRIAFADLR